MRHKRQKEKKHSKLLPIIGGLFIILIGVYGVGSVYYQRHFLPKTKVNQLNIGNKTIQKANDMLAKQQTKKEFIFTEKGKKIASVPLSDFGKKIDVTNELKNVKQQQNAFLFPFQAWNKKEFVIENNSFDKQALKQYLADLDQKIEHLNKNRKSPTNASLQFEKGTFKIIPSKKGDVLDKKAIATDFQHNLQQGKTNLALDNYQVLPTITEDSPQLKQEIKKAEKIKNVQVTYKINEEKVTISKETIASWLVFENGKLSLDQEKVQTYLSDLSNKYSTSALPYTFKSTKRGEVSVPAGSYGYTIQAQQEAPALTEDILKGEDVERTPIIAGSGSITGPRIGNTYVEVDLQNQHMWYYKDGKLILDTDVVTGKPSSPTPAGVFYIWNKERNAVLRGPNGDGTNYASPVDYWMPIDWTGVGIHDSNWQPTYGGNWYVNNGSHGCVNTPPSVMKQLFESVEQETPVLVF